MKYFIVLCIFAVLCSAFGAPTLDNHELLTPSNRDIDLLGNTKKLIVELVGNLRNSAEEALHAVGTFNAGIRDEAKEVRDKIINDILKFRVRVTEAVDNVMHRVSNSSLAVKECVNSHRAAAAAVFNETLSNTMACVDERIAEVTDHVTQLSTLATDAMGGAGKAIQDMKKCTAGNTNLLAAGACLGSVAVHTELNAVGFVTHSGILMGRINLGIASLPASLEVCAGTRLIQTGIATGKIMVEIGTCSATGIFNTIIGKPHAE